MRLLYVVLWAVLVPGRSWFGDGSGPGTLTHLPVDPLELAEVDVREVLRCDVGKVPDREKRESMLWREDEEPPPSSSSVVRQGPPGRERMNEA